MTGNVEITKYLCEQGANIEEVSDDGFTPLLHAVERGHTDVVKFLIHYGADCTAVASGGHAKHGQGSTALHIAAEEGHKAVVTLLMIARGACVRACVCVCVCVCVCACVFVCAYPSALSTNPHLPLTNLSLTHSLPHSLPSYIPPLPPLPLLPLLPLLPQPTETRGATTTMLLNIVARKLLLSRSACECVSV